jgi:hypothetical protein
MKKSPWILSLFVFLLISCKGLNSSEFTVIYADGSVQTRILQSNSLIFSQERIVRIEGLEDLSQLEELVLRNLPNDFDLASLAGLSQVKVLVLDGLEISELDFIESMTSLEALIIQGSSVTIEQISFTSDRLDYVEISNSGLISVPDLLNLDLTKVVFNFAFNNISEQSSISEIDNAKILILSGNPLNFTDPAAILDTALWNYIPEPYLKYLK